MPRVIHQKQFCNVVHESLIVSINPWIKFTLSLKNGSTPVFHSKIQIFSDVPSNIPEVQKPQDKETLSQNTVFSHMYVFLKIFVFCRIYVEIEAICTFSCWYNIGLIFSHWFWLLDFIEGYWKSLWVYVIWNLIIILMINVQDLNLP